MITFDMKARLLVSVASILLGFSQQSFASDAATQSKDIVNPSALTTVGKIARDAVVAATGTGLFAWWWILRYEWPAHHSMEAEELFLSAIPAAMFASLAGSGTFLMSSIVRGYQYLRAKAEFYAAKKAQRAHKAQEMSRIKKELLLLSNRVIRNEEAMQKSA